MPSPSPPPPSTHRRPSSQVNLPKPLSWREFVAALGELTAYDWVALLGFLALLAAGMRAVRDLDNRSAYASSYPRYFETFGRQHSDRWWARASGASMLFMLTQHHIFGVLFALPTDELHRTHKLMVVYVTSVTELAVLILFYGTNNDSPALRFWAAAIDMAIVFVCGALSAGTFSRALIKHAAVEPQAAEERGWRLLLRQTHGERPSKRLQQAWRHPLLLARPGACRAE